MFVSGFGIGTVGAGAARPSRRVTPFEALGELGFADALSGGKARRRDRLSFVTTFVRVGPRDTLHTPMPVGLLAPQPDDILFQGGNAVVTRSATVATTGGGGSELVAKPLNFRGGGARRSSTCGGGADYP